MWVQASAGGAPFVDLVQVAGDPTATWQQATVDLAPFAGSVVRVLFATIDEKLNKFRVWYIDEVALGRPRVFLPLVLRNH